VNDGIIIVTGQGVLPDAQKGKGEKMGIQVCDESAFAKDQRRKKLIGSDGDNIVIVGKNTLAWWALKPNPCMN